MADSSESSKWWDFFRDAHVAGDKATKPRKLNDASACAEVLINGRTRAARFALREMWNAYLDPDGKVAIRVYCGDGSKEWAEGYARFMRANGLEAEVREIERIPFMRPPGRVLRRAMRASR